MFVMEKIFFMVVMGMISSMGRMMRTFLSEMRAVIGLKVEVAMTS